MRALTPSRTFDMPPVGVACERESRTRFRADIEGLRGVAILLVVLYHAGVAILPGGFVGVDIFFVISGYLITGLLQREYLNSGRIDFLRFYARRSRRLLPASTVMTLVTLASSFFLFAPFEHHRILRAALSSTLSSSNLYFAHIAMDYFSVDSDTNPLLHTWSLGVEEQFYFVWPALAAFCLSRANQRWLMRTLVLIILASLMFSIWLLHRSPVWTFFLLPTRAWEFAMGALAFVVQPKLPDIRTPLVPWLALGTLLFCSALYTLRTPFPGLSALPPVLATAALLVSPAGGRSTFRRVIESPALRIPGRLSYSWYLWHWPVLVLAAAAWPLNRGARLGLCILSLGFAAVSYRWIEEPMRLQPGLARHPKHTIALSVAMTCGLAAAYASLFIVARRLQQSPGQIAFTRAASDMASIYSDGCHVGYFESSSPPCIFGDLASSTSLVLFGDSHAAQWFPAMERIAVMQGWRLHSLTKSACPAAMVHIYDGRLGRAYVECDRWRTATLQRLLALHPALVVISESDHYVARHTVMPMPWQNGLRETLQTLSRAHIPVLVLRDTPLSPFDLPECESRAAWRHTLSVCSFRPDTANRIQAATIEQAASDQLPGVSRSDLTHMLCPEDICMPIHGSTLLYRDKEHLTTGAALSLQSALQTGILHAMSANQ